MITVFITTSGIGSRLGKYTYHTNKSLIQIGNKLSICYIIDKYDSNTTHFVITLGYFGDLVREFLDLAYENNNFTYVYVDNYDGDGSSMGYSMLQAKPYLQCPFMFYCCDSIVMDNIVISQNCKDDIMYVAQSDDADSYVSISASDTTVRQIHAKGYNTYDYVYTGVAYIYNYAKYWAELEYLYNCNKNNRQLSDASVFQELHAKKHNIKYSILKQWYDTGNFKAYNAATKYVKCDYDMLPKIDQSICFLKGKVLKFFSNKNDILNIVFRGNLLYPKTPKITNYTEHFYCMEFVEGTLMSKVYQYDSIYKLLQWSFQHLWKNPKTDEIYIQKCMEFYKDKTMRRLEELDIIKENKEHNIINGIQTLPIKHILHNLDWTIICTDTFYNYHGDFILENIIKTNDTYVLIDWRPDFAGELTHGDIYYDLAKLRHNIILNYSNITSSLYTFHIKNDTVEVDLKCNYVLMQQLDSFDRFVVNNNLNLKKIKILSSIIWINMAPLHHNISEFLFYFGKYNLALCLTED
jgi:NDP-sugar pyrophosphorylase family protein